MCVHIWSYIWVNYNDLTDLPHWSPSLEIMVNKRNHPQMAARFRLVKYYNLPIYHIYIYRLVNHPLVEKSPDRVSVASDVECWIPRSSQTDQAPWPMAHYYNTQSCGVKQCHEPAIWDWFIPPLKLWFGGWFIIDVCYTCRCLYISISILILNFKTVLPRMNQRLFFGTDLFEKPRIW